MTTLYHLAERPDWAAAQAAGSYEKSTRGVSLAEEGFIHCSRRHQVRGIADLLFEDAADVVLLVIDSDRLTVEVRYEPAVPGGEAYPHIYGPLPLEAVTEAIPLDRDAAGRLVLPFP
jgi:uncharacterized protein (DUF952 family)